MCTINKSVHTKKSGNLFNDPRKNKNNQFSQSHLFPENIRLCIFFPMLIENIEFKVTKITYIEVMTIL